jgi:hypothetical protein
VLSTAFAAAPRASLTRNALAYASFCSPTTCIPSFLSLLRQAVESTSSGVGQSNGSRSLGYATSMGRPGFARTLARQGTGITSGRLGQNGGEAVTGRHDSGSRSVNGSGTADYDSRPADVGWSPSEPGDGDARPWSLGQHLQSAAAAAGGGNLLEEILDEEAAQRRLGALMQLSAAQKRALEALASDRASLEAALGVAQRRFKAELDARRQAEAAAAATLSSLADERGKLDAARAAHSALLAD